MKILDILCAFVFLVMTIGGFIILLRTPLEDGRYFYQIFITTATAIGFWGVVFFADRLLESKRRKDNPSASSKEKG